MRGVAVAVSFGFFACSPRYLVGQYSKLDYMGHGPDPVGSSYEICVT